MKTVCLMTPLLKILASLYELPEHVISRVDVEDLDLQSHYHSQTCTISVPKYDHPVSPVDLRDKRAPKITKRSVCIVFAVRRFSISNGKTQFVKLHGAYCTSGFCFDHVMQ